MSILFQVHVHEEHIIQISITLPVDRDNAVCLLPLREKIFILREKIQFKRLFFVPVIQLTYQRYGF